jgi:6,7-dimethyl-8-ribityllumazine synthase
VNGERRGRSKAGVLEGFATKTEISDQTFRIGNLGFQVSDLRFQISDFRSQISHFRFQISNSNLEISNSTVPKVYEGKVGPAEGRFAIVVARFNETITSRLLSGAVEMLTAHGVGNERIDVVWVPGAFEIPPVANRLAESGGYVAVLCLGAVIRGETSHDQHINRAVSMAFMEIGLRTGVPVLFGVLTCNTLEQAIARSGGQAGTRGKDRPDSRIGNKGSECAEAALEMVNLMPQLPHGRAHA